MKRIVADPRKCLACRGCELACAMAHASTDDLARMIAEQASKPRIYIESAGGLAVPLQCRHCDDAPCVRVCPTSALSRQGPTAPVRSDQTKCIGCAFCVEACPFGVIRLAAARGSAVLGNGKVVLKCDLCETRVAQGLAPACVAACPVSALRFEDVDQGAKNARVRTAMAALAGFADGRE